jgi:hypothetical protein
MVPNDLCRVRPPPICLFSFFTDVFWLRLSFFLFLLQRIL